MEEKVQEELKKLEGLDSIRPVKMPTYWCTPIVAVPNQMGKCGCASISRSSVRVCVKRTVHYLQQINYWPNWMVPQRSPNWTVTVDFTKYHFIQSVRCYLPSLQYSDGTVINACRLVSAQDQSLFTER